MADVQTSVSNELIGKFAYERYADVVEGRSPFPKLPGWRDLSIAERDGWIYAAAAIGEWLED